MWAVITLTALVLVGASAGNPNDRQNGARGYIESGGCTESHICAYKYAATQELFQGEVQENLTFTATVEISCDSVGTFNGVSQAIRYCMTIKDAMVYSMDGDSEEDDISGESSGTGEKSQTLPSSADHFFSGWFCFVQTEDGKVVAIYHSKEDHPSAVNIKKSIAAAFQANFKGTDTEEEMDPQSIHTSHYRYEQRKDGFMMHRTIGDKDVVDYTLHVPKDDVMLTKEEDIEYKSGKLYHSAGRTSVKLLSGPDVEKDTERDSLLADVRADPGERDRKRRETDGQEDSETYDGSTRIMFSAEGVYTLDLTYCYSVPRVASRHRRTVEEGLKKEFVESTLMAQLNQALDDKHVMADLHQKVPSVAEALLTLHQNLDDTKLADKLQLLLELESKHGPLEGFKPALEDVLSYLEKLQKSDNPEDIHMRTVIYSLLGPEGSLASQKALLHALETVTDEKERNALSLYIALTNNPHPMLISRMQEILHSNAQSTDSLLLAYGALTSKLSPELQHQAVKFLLEKLNSVQENSDSLVHLIHSLGNSASDLTLDPLLDYAASENLEVQLAAIYALRKHTNNVMVQEAFIAILRKTNVQENQIATITQALNAGLEHIKLSGSTNIEYNNPELVVALASAAMEVNNPELYSSVAQYLLNLKTEIAAKYAQALQSKIAEAGAHGNNTLGKLKRDASDSLVSSRSPRAVSAYPNCRAYQYDKRFGLSNLYAQFNSEGFAGVNPETQNYKMFGRASARGHAFGRSATGLDAQILNEKQNGQVHLKVYASVVGNVLVNTDYWTSSCTSRVWSLISRRYTLLSFSHSVYIFVSTLRFSVRVTAEMDFNAEAELSFALPTDVSVTLPLTLTVRADGDASASLAEIVRGGISVDASFTYRVEPEASSHLCLYNGGLKSQNCVNIYDSWPSSYAETYAWYQRRSIKWCKRWRVKYPCGFTWGSQHRWSDLSERWDLGSRGRRTISSTCDTYTRYC